MGPRRMDGWARVPCVLLLVVLGSLLVGASSHAIRDGSPRLRFQTGRILQEAKNSSDSSSVLSDRTERIDPLNDFKKYKGGYNITNKHYWSSSIFTGKYEYGIAIIWLLGGLIYGAIVLIMAIAFAKKRKREKRVLFSKRYFLWSILLSFILTVLAIVASGVVLGGSTRFHSTANTVKNIIVETADGAYGNIYNVTTALRAVQNDTQLYGNAQVFDRLNSTLDNLIVEAASLKSKAEKNMRRVSKGLSILNVVTIVTISISLALILALLASGSLKFRRTFNLLIIVCWVFTFLFWTYFGLYYFVNKFAGDSCIALDEYQEDPQHSSLRTILPCNNQVSAQNALRETGEGIHDIIDLVNANISKSLSLANQEYVCNPFSGPPDYNYQPESCHNNSIPVGDIPKVLKAYTCMNSNGASATCGQGQFVSASDYNRAVVYSTSVQQIINSYPGLQKLADCQIVKDAFSDILNNQCKPLKKYAHMTWAAMAALSTTMVILLLVSVLLAHHLSRSHCSDGSVNPHSTPTCMSDVDTQEVAMKRSDIMVGP